jgi:hypothetical protein
MYRLTGCKSSAHDRKHPDTSPRRGRPGSSRDNGRLKPPCNHKAGEASDPDRIAKTPLPVSGVCRQCNGAPPPLGFRIGYLSALVRSPAQKCYLPRQPARCSIRLAEKVAAASPRFPGSARSPPDKEIRPRDRMNGSGAAKSRWIGITRGRAVAALGSTQCA